MFDALRGLPATSTATLPPGQLPATLGRAGLLPPPAPVEDGSMTTSDTWFPPTNRYDHYRALAGFKRHCFPGGTLDDPQGYRQNQETPRFHLDQPRLPRLELPIYDGSEDPITWLNKCEHYFRAYQTTEEDKVWMATFRLSSIAHSWFYQLEQDEGTISWPVFKHYC